MRVKEREIIIVVIMDTSNTYSRCAIGSVCMCVCLCVCLCLRERDSVGREMEREREREIGGERERESIQEMRVECYWCVALLAHFDTVVHLQHTHTRTDRRADRQSASAAAMKQTRESECKRTAGSQREGVAQEGEREREREGVENERSARSQSAANAPSEWSANE